MILRKELEISGRKKPDILKVLHELKFAPMEEIKAILNDAMVVDEEDDDGDSSLRSSSFDYLLNMQFWSLSHERIEELSKEKSRIESELEALELKNIKEIWREDIDEFVSKYEDYLKSYRKVAGQPIQGQGHQLSHAYF